MFCSISGNMPEQPVVSTKSGHVFEKRLVEKYVRETGKCPITNEALTVEDLMALKTNKTIKPRTAPATSIPGLLGLFHDEWDALMLETHQLRQSLNAVRQELCHALYQHDAATRVIARLIRERDDARSALENARATLQADGAKRGAQDGAAGGPAGKKQRTPAIPEEVLQEMSDLNAQLSKGRRKREISKTLATPEDLGNYALLSSVPLHKTTQGGITQVELNPEDASVLATAGVDATVQVYNHGAGRQVATLEGHTKKVSGLQFVSSTVILTSSHDKTSRIWRADAAGSWACSAVIKDQQAEVVGVAVHPSRKYFLTGAADASWSFYDLESATCLQTVADEVKDAYTTVQLHPDGLIFGTATEGCQIRIWELKQQKAVATFSETSRPVRSLCFSENGYYLAAAAEDAVKVFDLRKLKVLKTLAPSSDAACTVVTWDHSGHYLGVGGRDVTVYNSKQDWSVVRTFQDLPKKGVLSLKFGPDARQLFVGAADHNLRIFGAAQA